MRFIKLNVLSVLLMTACALPMQGMQAAFAESLENTIGRSLNDLKHEEGRAFIGSREPTEVRFLDNGNTLHVYENYWAHYGIEREPCTVFLEFEPEAMSVVRASSEGQGCYRAY